MAGRAGAPARCRPDGGGLALLPVEGILGALQAVGAGSLIAAASMIAWRILAQRADRIRGKHAAGDLPGTELTVIAEAIRDADWQRQATSASYEHRAVPRDVYVGLAGSARLADFDPPTRDLLYRFYWRAALGDHAYMNRYLKEVIEGVARFTAENAPGARAAAGRLGRRLARRRNRGVGALRKRSYGRGNGRNPGQSATGTPMGGGSTPSTGDAGGAEVQGATGAPMGGGT